MQSTSIRQRGFTLLEVLIAVVILSIGLLGVAGMQASAMRNNHSAYSKTQATALAMDIADRIRINSSVAANYDFDTDSDVPESKPGCMADANGCSPTDLAEYDIYEWSQPIISAESPILPGGRAIIERNGTITTIAIYWREPQFKDLNAKRITPCLESHPELNEMGCLAMSLQS